MFALLRGVIFLVPSFILVPKLLGINGIWMSLSVSEIMTSLCISAYYLYNRHRDKVVTASEII